MLSLVNLSVAALEHIADQLPHKEKLRMRLISRFFRDLIPPCVTVKVKQLSSTIHIHSSFAEGPLTEAFLADHEHSLSATKEFKTTTGLVNCARVFAFPPSSNFSFFSSAKIDHLLVCENFPVVLNTENLKHFTNLLRGCTIDKISLAFEHETAGNLSKIGPLIAQVRAVSVDFVLVRMDYRADHWNGAFAPGLVAAGVQEVSFSGKAIEREIHTNNRQAPDEPFRSLAILVRLFAAGIKRVTVNPDALIEGDLSFAALTALVEKLTALGKRVRLDLHVRTRLTEMHTAHLNGVNGVSVNISKSTKIMRNRRSYRDTCDFISIECDGNNT